MKEKIEKFGTPLMKPETKIEHHGPTDRNGRCHFSLRWVDDYFPGHPEGEYVRRERGQQYHADPRKYGHVRPEEREGGVKRETIED